MRAFHIFFVGILCASIIFGPWWLILTSGIVALVFRRSYVVLAIAVLLDLWFMTSGAPSILFGFYTLTFTLVTFLVEYIRKDLFWTS